MLSPTVISLSWIFAWGGLAAVVIISIRSFWPPKETLGGSGRFHTGEMVYAGLLLLSLLLFRWPGFFVQRALNPDEAQFIAGALTLWGDPIFWRSVDGQTSGPLIYFALLPLKPLGLLNYTGARLIGCLMVFGTLWFSYRSLRVLVGEGLARLCLLPAFCFFAFSIHTEFVHYSSEHAPLLLLAIGMNGITVGIALSEKTQFSLRPWLVAGVALGAVPFAKLQAVPPAAALLLTGSAWWLTRSSLAWAQRWTAVAKLAAAVCVVPLCFALMLTLGGAWESFWYSYFVDNLAYFDSSLSPARETVSSLGPFLLTSRAWCVYVTGCLAVIGAALWQIQLRDSALRWGFLLVAVFSAASVPFSLFTRRYPHYLLFLVIPVVLLAGITFASAWLAPAQATSPAPRWRRHALVVVLGLGIVAQITVKSVQGNPFLDDMSGIRPVPHDIARVVLRQVEPGDEMAVWGWRAELHVETGLPQATSNSNAASQITPSRIQRYFVQRYVRELQHARPRIFVDAVGHSKAVTDYTNRKLYAHEQFPVLATYIAQNYEQLAEIDGARIYRRIAK